jgi:hypothetical protein
MYQGGKTCVECQALGELLVDYADAATSTADSIRVERHLAKCAACRAELAALRRSLCLLESVWADADVAVAPHARPRPLPVPRWRLAAALGGVAAAVGLALGVYRAQRPADDPPPVMANASEGLAGDGQMAANEEKTELDLDIDAYIQRNEQLARLAASVQILTSLPVEPEDAERAQRYLRDAYGADQASSKSGEFGKL